jgi:hypothetical protein
MENAVPVGAIMTLWWLSKDASGKTITLVRERREKTAGSSRVIASETISGQTWPTTRKGYAAATEFVAGRNAEEAVRLGLQ